MRNCLPIAIAAIVAAVLPLPAVRAQSVYFGDDPQSRGSLEAGGRTWTIGNPEAVASGVYNVLPSRDFLHLLIVRHTRALSTKTPAKDVLMVPGSQGDIAAPGEVVLTWWNVRAGRGRDFWRMPLSSGDVRYVRLSAWLGKSGTAVASLRNKTGQAQILYVEPTQAKVRMISLPQPSYDFPNPSPATPFVALAGADGACDGEVRFLDASGGLGEPIPLPAKTTWFTRWSNDGTELWGTGSAKNADGTYREQWYAINPARRTVTEIAAPPKDANGDTDYDNFPEPGQNLPLRLASDKEGTVRIEAFPAKPGAAVVVARDARPAFLLPNGTGAFFFRDGALFFAPIVSGTITQATPPERQPKR